MNKMRRNEIKRAMSLIDKAKEILETVWDEEEEAYDNLPEGIQSSERGEQMADCIYALSDYIENLDYEELYVTAEIEY